MAYIAMAYIVMADIVMAHVVMAYIHERSIARHVHSNECAGAEFVSRPLFFCVQKDYVVVAYIVMAYIGMA